MTRRQQFNLFVSGITIMGAFTHAVLGNAWYTFSLLILCGLNLWFAYNKFNYAHNK